MDDGTSPPPVYDAPAPPAPVTTSGSPSDFLKGVVGKRVVVRLTSGVDYRGAFHHRFLHPLTHSHPTLPRRVVLSRRIHEYRVRTDGGARWWQSNQPLWGRVHPREQRWVEALSPDQNLPLISFLSSPLYLGRRNPIEAAVRGPNPTFDPLAPKNLLLVFHVLPMWISFYEL